jgi:hypothetical protein
MEISAAVVLQLVALPVVGLDPVGAAAASPAAVMLKRVA